MATAQQIVAYPHIVSTPGVCGGRPVIDGTRITVAEGVSVERGRGGAMRDTLRWLVMAVVAGVTAAAVARGDERRLTVVDIPQTSVEVRSLIEALLTGKSGAAQDEGFLARIKSAGRNQEWAVRATAAFRLGELGSRAQDAIPFLAQTFGARGIFFVEEIPSGRGSSLQEESAIAIGKIGGYDGLVQALPRARGQDMGYFYQAFGQVGDPRAVGLLMSALEKGGNSAEAASALGRIGDPRALDALLPVLKRGGLGGVGTRQAAAEALGAIGDLRAVGPLVEFISTTRWPAMRGTAGRSLAKLTGQSLGGEGQVWKEWWEREGRARHAPSPRPNIPP